MNPKRYELIPYEPKGSGIEFIVFNLMFAFCHYLCGSIIVNLLGFWR